MLAYEITKWLHLLGATVLLGTGAGIAFFMLMAHRTHDPRLIQHVASTVVIADALFTATAVVAQPITGTLSDPPPRPFFRPSSGSGPPSRSTFCHGPLLAARRMDPDPPARHGRARRLPPTFHSPAAYYRLFGIWFACGLPAFFSVLAIVWLMLSKPAVSPF